MASNNTDTSRPSVSTRRSSTVHYTPFPTSLKPPRTAGQRQFSPQREGTTGGMRNYGTTARRSQDGHNGSCSSSTSSRQREETPLPKGQLIMLAVIALAEQTAFNSISPYLPDMVASFADVDPARVGLSVGLIASAFASAQFLTNFAWGWLSDRVGRKPIVLSGTLLTACCFVAFGFCRTLRQAIVVQAFMGLVNGNQGIISTCLGEITDRSNQSKAFTYLPVIYGLGGITGPIVGGLLVMKNNPFHPDVPNPYPYLAPNLLSAAVLILDLVLTMFFLKESLECAQDLPPLNKRIKNMFAWIWQFGSSHRPTYLRQGSKYEPVANGRATDGVADEDIEDDDEDDEDDEDGGEDEERNQANERTGLLSRLFAGGSSLISKEIWNRDTILLLVTFLIFQLSNISFNSLYPIFAQAQPPTGRDLNPGEIGVSLAFAGVITILFQVGIFGRLREKIGNRATYRAGLAGFVVAFLLIPWVGYKTGSDAGDGPTTNNGKVWLWIELGVCLVIKTVAAVGGLTSALLLITNTAHSHSVLGTLNGLAQTLSAAGRAVGPFVSGSLFSAATNIRPKGEAMAFGVFGGVALVGFLLSLGIRSPELEAEGWDENRSGDEEEGDDEEDDNNSDDELSPRRGARR